MRPRLVRLAILAVPLISQDLTLSPHGTPPRESASSYPVHASVGSHALGAEYLVRSLQGRNGTFVTRDHLVIEVAFYGPKLTKLLVSTSHFSLRVNKQKSSLRPQAPSFVAASLRYADWETRPRATIGAGVGDAGVILGGPPVTGRFPGDPRERQPSPPRAPEPPDPSGSDKEEPPRADEFAVESALPEGELALPVSGYLYFAYKGKPKSIRSLELIYDGPAGSSTLRLL